VLAVSIAQTRVDEGVEGIGNGEGVSPPQSTMESGERRKLHQQGSIRMELQPKSDFVESEGQKPSDDTDFSEFQAIL